MDPITAVFWLALSFAVSYAFREKQTIEQGRIQDLEVQSSTYGTFIKKVYGRARIAGNLIWLRNNKIEERRKTKTQNGIKTRTYTYYADLAIGICEGPVHITAVWADTDVIAHKANKTNNDNVPWAKLLAYLEKIHSLGGGIADTADTPVVSYLPSKKEELTIFRGGMAQPQSPRIVSEHGAASTPAWRGLAYMTLDDFALQDFGNRIPDFRFEVLAVEGGTIGIKPVLEVYLGAGHSVGGACDGYEVVGNILKVVKTQGTSGGGNLFYETWIDIPSGTTIKQEFRDLSPEWTSLSAGGSAVANDIRFYLKAHNDYAPGLESISGFYVRGKTYDVKVGMPYHPENLTWAFNGNRTFWRRGNHLYCRTYDYSCATPGNSAVGYRLAKFQLPPNWDTRTTLVHKMPMLQWVSGLSSNGPDYYDESTDEFMLTCNETDKVWIIDGATLAVKEKFTLPGNLMGPVSKWGDITLHSNGTLPFRTEIWRLNRGQGTMSLVTVSDTSPVLTLNYFGRFISSTQFICEDGIFTWFVPDDDGVSLETVVKDILMSAGIAEANINATALAADTVRGYVLDSYDTARAHLEPLQMMYQFDLVERDYKITAVKRTGTSMLDISYDELGAAENGSTAERIGVVEEDLSQLPSRVNINFSNFDNEFEPGVEFARRKAVSQVNVLDIQTNMTFTADEAAQKADILLREAWLGGRYKYNFRLTKKYSWLEPGDVVRIVPAAIGQMSDRAVTLRIQRIEEGNNGILAMEGAEVGSTSYQSTAKGALYPTKNPTGQAAPSPTLAVLVDTPTLNDYDAPDPGAYMAFTGLYSNWAGAQLRISRDGGVTFVDTGDLAVDSVITGSLQNTKLGDWIYENIDRVNTVTVTLATTWQTLSSCTDEEFLNGANRCIIGVNGRWEICAFQTATLIGPNKYTLSNFMRGQCGTENEKATHDYYEQFIFVGTMQADQPGPIRFPLLSTDYNVERSYEFQGEADAEPTNFGQHTTLLLCAAPFPAAHVRGFRDGTGDVRINWFRQPRWDRGWPDARENDLVDLASYEIEIYTSSAYTTLKRTVTGLSTTNYNYTAALQTTDFGAPQATVYVRIYQLSANTTRGRGIYKQAAI